MAVSATVGAGLAVCALAARVQIAHWFNPLLWLGFARMRSDRELACDALALAAADPGEHRAYGQTILKLLERFARPSAMPGLVGILEDKHQMKRRIGMIARFKQPPRWSIGGGLLLAACAALGLTDARSNKAPRAAQEATGGPRLTGIVRWPDGRPAAAAQVGLWRPDSRGHLRNGQMAEAFDLDPLRLQIPSQHDPSNPAAATQGRASVDSSALGRLEGTLRIGNRPASGQQLRLVPVQQNGAAYDLETDVQGRFTKAGLPPGRYTLLGEVRRPDGRVLYGPTGLEQELGIGINQTARVDLVWTGQPVIGRFVSKPKDAARRWTHSLATLTSTDFGLPGETNGFVRILRVDSEGWFAVPDVPPGTYRVGQTVHWPEIGLGPGAGSRFDRRMGGGGREFQVSAKLRQAEPIDLSAIEMTFERELKAGDMAPEFTARSLDGQAVRLRDFRGRHVLLHFWYSGPGVQNDMAALRKVHQQFEQDPRLAMVSVHASGPHDFAEHGGNWTLCRLDDAGHNEVLEAYGYGGSPWIFLISPYGRIVAADLIGPGIEAAARHALGYPETGQPTNAPPQVSAPSGQSPADDRLWITVQADGKPVPGAVVRFRFHKGRGKASGPGTTDEHGRIFVYLNPDVEWVQAQKGNRFGELEMRAVTNGSRLVLEAPGNVRGTLWLGGRPWTNQVLVLQRFGFEVPPTGSDGEGRFEFRDVAAGPWVVGLGGRAPTLTPIDVRPTSTTRVDLRLEGRVGAGQAFLADPARSVHWPHAEVFVRRGPTAHGDYILGVMRKDGAFRFPLLPPGDYILFVAPQDGPPPMARGIGGSGPVPFTVRTNRNDGDTPLDLGRIRVDLRKELQPGEPARTFSVETFEGATFRLDEHKGRAVVLAFWWASPYSGDRAVLSELQQLRHAMKAEARVVWLGLNYNAGDEEPLDWIRQLGLDWPQGRALPVRRIFDEAYRYPGSPYLVLIGPDQRVVGHFAKVNEVRPVLERLLAGLPPLRPAEEPAAPR